MDSNAPAQGYAWLEREKGTWHFLTDLFADPGESTRRWSDRLRALEELKKEGWMVISPYPEAAGYGLRRISDRSSLSLRDYELNKKTRSPQVSKKES